MIIEKLEKVEDCEFYKDGGCVKFRNRRKCKPATMEWFDEEFAVIEMSAVCRNSSIFGNSYFVITDEEIEALKNGKVLFMLDEYGTVIAYRGSEEE